MTKLKKYLPWLTGLLMATGLFILLQLISYFRFENSDDILIVKSFMGFEGGEPAAYNMFLHTFLAHFLGWISRLAPGVAWFSLFQLAVLWLSTAVVVKCVMQCALSRGTSYWIGLALAGLFGGMEAAFACARINFTTTAAMAGAAGVAQLCTLGLDHKRLFGASLLSMAMVLLCYCIRPQSLLASLPFFLLALAWVVARRWHEGAAPLPRAMAAGLLAGVICLSGFMGVRAIEERDPVISALLEFQDANLGALDYDDSVLRAVPDEVLADIGWSRAELELVRQWYFMDENITAEAFRKLDAAAAADVSLGQRVGSAFQSVGYFYRDNARYRSSAVALLLLCALCICLPAESKGLRPTALAAGACIPLAAAMLLYLGYGGRFLGRAADCALMPCAAVLCCLTALSLSGLRRKTAGSPEGRSPSNKPRQPGTLRHGMALALCGLCLCAGGLNLYQTRQVLNDRPDVVSATRETDLEAFALSEPTKLILRTPDLLRDTRLMPDVSGGLPANIMIWGDWYCRTPSWYRQLEVFGFDGYRFTAADFLRDNLLFVTAEAEPPTALLRYLEEGCGAVEFSLYGQQGDLYFFRFNSAL